MRSSRVCALAMVLLGALRSAASAAAPAIVQVEAGRTRTTDATGYAAVRSSFMVLVSDADGAADIASLTVDGYVMSPESPGFSTWEQQDATTVQVMVADFSDVVGSCTIAAASAGGESDELTLTMPAFASDLPPTSTSPGGGYPVLHEVAPVFSWSGLQPGATNSLVVQRASGLAVWSYDLGSATSVTYNADATAVDATLRPGFRYTWDLASHQVVDGGVTDARVHTSVTDVLHGRLLIYSEMPVIESLMVTRLRHESVAGASGFTELVSASVTDCEGWDHIASAAVTDPDGVSFHHPAEAGASYLVARSEDEYAASLECAREQTEALAAGTYALTVADALGQSATLGTPAAEVVPALVTVSPATDSVVEDAAPVFSWQAEGGPLEVDLTVRPMGSWSAVWTAAGIAATQATYNADGTGSDLEPGHTYLWSVGAQSEAVVVDDRVSMVTMRLATGRFTVYEPWPALAQLPGRLVYDLYPADPEQPGWIGEMAVQQYGTDADQRIWLGVLNAHAPAWSPDGRTLLYIAYDITIDALDGSDPPVIGAWPSLMPDSATWSPDGSQLAFAFRGNFGWGPSQLMLTRVDGSDARVIIPDQSVSDPAWSPDGEWIAYANASASTGYGLWLVRPEGTESHPVTVSGITGYPDAQLIALSGPSWSPDGQRLAVAFHASALPHDLWGIGVIPRDGGELKPVYVEASGYVCCRAAQWPCWSPDGTQIAFTSARHLPPDVAPDTGGALETGQEVWVIPADGSAAPVRLTYDDMASRRISWREVQPFSDVPADHWAYSAIDACWLAGIVSGYPNGSYGPSIPVTRDQMAVYVSRALAIPSGDAAIPDPQSPPSFSDVPADHWAYKWVEYAVSHGIVEGYPGGAYRPDQVVNRGQMAVYVARAIATPIGDTGVPEVPAEAVPTFTDVTSENDWAWCYKHVEYCAGEGVVQGYWDGTYHPERDVTRDQMAVYVARAFGLPM